MTPQERSIRVLLADDQLIARTGLRAMLAETGSIEVVAETGDADVAIESAARLQPDLVLMELHLSNDRSGVDTARELKATAPAVRVLFLTSAADAGALAATVAVGAVGYLLKDIGREALLRAIDAVTSGQAVFDPRVMSSMAPHAVPGLSPQEARILHLVSDGKTNKEIARLLNLSDKTVKNYLSNAYQKLGVGRRSHAAAIFAQRTTSAPAKNLGFPLPLRGAGAGRRE